SSKDSINSLRLILFAQSLTKNQLEDFEQKYNVPLLQLYGMTETVAPPLMNPLDSVQNNFSLGKPIVSVNIKLVDENENEINSNQTGQIIINGVPGRTIMKGYLKNQKETD